MTTTSQKAMLEVAADIARIEMTRWGLDKWNLEWNRSRRSLGVCSYSKKTIFISKIYASTNRLEVVLGTIRHEIAHALTAGDGHGKKWKAMCKKVGCLPERLNYQAVMAYQYRISCPNHCYTWHANRIKQNLASGQCRCLKCRSTLVTERGEFVR